MISLKTPQRKWASSCLEGRTSWIFSSCGRCSRLTKRASGTRSGGHRKGQSPCEFLGGLSGFLSRRCRGLRSCVEPVPQPEDSSPRLTWILGYFWSLPTGFSTRLEWGHARALSFRAVAPASRFPSCGSRDLWLSLETFPRGIPMGLSHEAFPQGCPKCHRGVSRSSARKSRQCRENRFPWNGLRHLGDSANGGTTLEFLSPFLWRAPHLEMRRKRREFIPNHTGKGSLLSSYEADTGLLWM